MPNSLVLATVSQALVFPCVSCKSGRLCRTVPTRQLILEEAGPSVTLIACIDRRQNIHRTAVRDVMSLHAGIIAHPRGGVGFRQPQGAHLREVRLSSTSHVIQYLIDA